MTNKNSHVGESWQQHLDRERRRRNSPYGSELADDRLIPNPELPMGETAVYRTASITSLPQLATAPTELVKPLDIMSVDREQANGPAEGVLLTHEQAWRMKGVTLGKLLHSLSLAPGEVTQIAVTGWHRTTRGESAEDVAERERTAQSAGRQREIHDVTKGVAQQSQMGASVASASSTQTDIGLGGVLGFLGGSAASSTNAAFASTVGFNVGSRNVTADSKQSVRQATQQHASNTRGRRASLVQEVGESQTEQFKTRVVANYNHTHSLNLMYYEVLQVYELSTRVTDAQRCIFVPMEVMTFDSQSVNDFARPLARAAKVMGRVGLANAIEQLGQPVGTSVDSTDEANIQSIEDIVRQLNDQNLVFNQALWAQLDPTQVADMLAGKEHDGLSLTKTVDPTPVAVVGQFVGFRWNFPAQQAEQAAAFRDHHLRDDDVLIDDRDTVVLPTGGIFAEAVPGRANSAEKLDLTRFWKWDDKTIPILPTAIAKLHQVRRAQRAEAKPGSLGTPSVTLKPLPSAPAAPAHQLAAIIGTSVFRDMSGSEVIQGMLEAAQDASGSTSVAMQQLAHDNIKVYLDHLEALAPKVGELLKQQAAKGPKGGDGEGLNPSDLGGLQNALGEGGEGLDIGDLLGEAAELGLFL